MNRCTSVYGTPTMFIDIIKEQKKASLDLSSVRTGIMAGSVCPVELCKEVMSELNMTDFTVNLNTLHISFVISSFIPNSSLRYAMGLQKQVQCPYKDFQKTLLISRQLLLDIQVTMWRSKLLIKMTEYNQLGNQEKFVPEVIRQCWVIGMMKGKPGKPSLRMAGFILGITFYLN